MLQRAGIAHRRNVGSCPETLSTNQKHRCSVKKIVTITVCFPPCSTSAVCGAQLCLARCLSVSSTAQMPPDTRAAPHEPTRLPTSTSPTAAPARLASSSLPPGLGLNQSLLFISSLRKGAIFVPFCVSCPIQSFPSFLHPKIPLQKALGKIQATNDAITRDDRTTGRFYRNQNKRK